MKSIIIVLVTLQIITFVAADFPTQCHCGHNQCASYDATKTKQCAGFVAINGMGRTYQRNLTYVKEYGMTLGGTPCATKCTSCWMGNKHCCKPLRDDGTMGAPDYCALYNRDNYGRECLNVNKGFTNGNWCRVEQYWTYWAIYGGSWGWTHPPACEDTGNICIVPSVTTDSVFY